MRKKIIFFLIIICISVTACFTNKNNNAEGNLSSNTAQFKNSKDTLLKHNLEIKNSEDSILNKYSVEAEESNGEIFITDNQTNQKVRWGKVDNSYSGHYHFAEYHKPNLYVIRRFDTDDPWKDELWVYSSPNNGELLFKQQGIDFRVNKKQTLLAYGNVDTLMILNLANNKTSKIKISKENNNELSLDDMRWNSNKDIIWGLLALPARGYYNFFSYDCNKKKLEEYDVPEDLEDYDLNPNLGLLLYSDFPIIFDSDASEDLLKSKTKIHLYVLDLRTNKRKLIKTSIAKEFSPKWITKDVIEYNSLTSNKRERIKYIK